MRDRFDLSVEVQAVPWRDLRATTRGESSAAVRARVVAARARQRERGEVLNSRLEGALLRRVCGLDPESEKLLGRAMERQLLSARGATRVLRAARTIADLAGRDAIASADVAEALQFHLPM